MQLALAILNAKEIEQERLLALFALAAFLSGWVRVCKQKRGDARRNFCRFNDGV
jgi:hypothetical protein